LYAPLPVLNTCLNCIYYTYFIGQSQICEVTVHSLPPSEISTQLSHDKFRQVCTKSLFLQFLRSGCRGYNKRRRKDAWFNHDTVPTGYWAERFDASAALSAQFSDFKPAGIIDANSPKAKKQTPLLSRHLLFRHV